MFANCSMPGMDMAMPDVCKTPVPPPVTQIPVPYPNLGMRATALPPTTSMKHLLTVMPSHNISTTMPTSLGDTAGVLGGMVSSTMMGPVRNTKCSSKIITGGTPATRMLDTTIQNNINASGMTLVPGQFKVLYLT